MSRSGFAAVVTRCHNAGVGRQRPAVVDKAFQNDLEDDGLGLLGSVGQFVEEQNVQLTVGAQLFQLDQPHRLNINNGVGGFVVHRTTVDGFGSFVHQFDVQRLRVDLADTVGLAVAAETVEEYGDIGFHVRTNQRQLIVAAYLKAAGFGRYFLLHIGQLGQEAAFQIVHRSLTGQTSEQCHTADEQLAVFLIQPAHREYFYKYIFPFGDYGAIGQTNIACHAPFFEGHANNFLATQTVHGMCLARNCDAAPCLGKGTAGIFSGSHGTHGLIQHHIGIAAEFHNGNGAVGLLAAKQMFVTLLQHNHGTHRAKLTGVVTTEAVHHPIGEIVVNGRAVGEEAVIIGGKQRQIRCGSCSAHLFQNGQQPTVYLFM